MGNIIRRYNITVQKLLKEPMELPEGAIFVGVEIRYTWVYDIFVHALVDSNTKKTEKYYFRTYWVGKGFEEKEIEKGFTYLGSASTNYSDDENILVHVFYRKM